MAPCLHNYNIEISFSSESIWNRNLRGIPCPKGYWTNSNDNLFPLLHHRLIVQKEKKKKERWKEQRQHLKGDPITNNSQFLILQGVYKGFYLLCMKKHLMKEVNGFKYIWRLVFGFWSRDTFVPGKRNLTFPYQFLPLF